MKSSYDSRFSAIESLLRVVDVPGTEASSSTDRMSDAAKRAAPEDAVEPPLPPSGQRGLTPPPQQTKKTRFNAPLNRHNSSPAFGFRSFGDTNPTESIDVDGPPGRDKPKHLVASTFPVHLTRDERGNWGRQLLIDCPPDVGVTVTLNYGKGNLSNKMYLNFSSFAEALAYRKKYGIKENDKLKYKDSPMYLQFPKSPRDLVKRVYAKKLEEFVLDNLDKLKIDKNDIMFDRDLGSFFIRRYKIGYVVIGEDRRPNGSWPVSFTINEKEASTVGFNASVLKSEYEKYCS